MMKITRIALSHVQRSSSARDINKQAVASITASMKEIGQLTPIFVKHANIPIKGVMEPGYLLIAGNHRVEAARQLGWSEIDARVMVGESLEAELIEIDENLCRAELTAAQRASAIKRRKQIWEALHPDNQRFDSVYEALGMDGEPGGKTLSTRNDDGTFVKGEPKEKAFAASTAAVAGMTKQAINQHLSRAEALGDDLERIAGTSLDKGVELDALKAMPEPERKDLIDRAAAGEKVSARVSQKSDAEPAKTPVKVNAAEVFAADLHAALRLAMAKFSCRAVVPFGEMVEEAYTDLDEHQRKVFEEMRDAVMTVFEFAVPAESA